MCMQNMRIVVLDCDDVLYMTNEAALQRLNEEYGSGYSLEDITKWGSIGSLIDERLKYFSDSSFMESIPLYPEAEEFVKTLLDNDCEVFFCTSIEFSCTEARVRSLMRNFPQIKTDHIIIGKRKDLLACDYMLDDRIHNIETSRAEYPVLFDKPWNRSYRGCHGKKINDYQSFLSLLGI